jgi:hypothetical protein
MSNLDSKINYISRIGADLRQDFAAVMVPEMVTQILLVEILEELKVIEGLLKTSQDNIEVSDLKLPRNPVVSNTTKKRKSLKK